MKQPQKSDNNETCNVTQLWRRNIKQSFNDIAVGKIFRNKAQSLVLGHEDGVVRTYPIPKPNDSTHSCLESSLSLETKGGPIQTLAIHDVTKLNSNDVTVADSRGMVTVFSNGQILARRAVSEHCIQCLKIQQDALGHNAIVAGDQQGHVTAFSPFSEFWRIRLADTRQFKSLAVPPHVTCVHIAELMDSNGQKRNYVLVADTCKHVHLIKGGSIVLTLTTPAVVTAMTCGKFIDMEDSDLGGSTNQNSFDIQVAMGTDTGAIYLLVNFKVYEEELGSIKQTITCLASLSPSDSQSTDSLLCGGHFDALYVLQDGKEVSKYHTAAWINSLLTADINNDGLQEIVIGCHDNSIHGLQIAFS